MTGALGGDPLPVLRGEQDCVHYIVSGLREDDRRRPLIDRQIPGAPSLVIVAVLGEDDLAVERGSAMARPLGEGCQVRHE